MKKHLKRTLVCMCCALYALTSFSQEAAETGGKKSVYIDYFKRSTEVPAAWAEGLRNYVIEGIQKLDRVVLIDVDSQTSLHIEKSRRESDDISTGESNDMSRVSVMKQLGANSIIGGMISSMSAKKETMDDGSIYYSASIAYSLKIIDSENGTLIGTKTFKHGEGLTDICTGSTPDEAISKASAKAVKAVHEFIDENFKVEGVILEISAEKKGEAKELYINLGSAAGVSENTYFAVFVSRQIAGKDSRKEIGRLKVKAVEGEEISLCEVKKGGKEIQDAITAKQTVVINLVPKPKSFLDKAAGAVNSAI
ncbi:MAG: hypothetical protein RR386_05745 [Bacteroidaceae bacterium]